jgi:hypothetical protein
MDRRNIAFLAQVGEATRSDHAVLHVNFIAAQISNARTVTGTCSTATSCSLARGSFGLFMIHTGHWQGHFVVMHNTRKSGIESR